MTKSQLLGSQQEVADALGMSIDTLRRRLKEYPWGAAGLPPAVVNGRWRVPLADVMEWWMFVREQQRRHPEARRFRPAEPPEVALIRARSDSENKTNCQEGKKEAIDRQKGGKRGANLQE